MLWGKEKKTTTDTLTLTHAPSKAHMSRRLAKEGTKGIQALLSCPLLLSASTPIHLGEPMQLAATSNKRAELWRILDLPWWLRLDCQARGRPKQGQAAGFVTPQVVEFIGGKCNQNLVSDDVLLFSFPPPPFSLFLSFPLPLPFPPLFFPLAPIHPCRARAKDPARTLEPKPTLDLNRTLKEERKRKGSHLALTAIARPLSQEWKKREVLWARDQRTKGKTRTTSK